MNRKKYIKKIWAPTQSRDNPANLFMFMCFSFPEEQVFGETHVPLHGGCARNDYESSPQENFLTSLADLNSPRVFSTNYHWASRITQ